MKFSNVCAIREAEHQKLAYLLLLGWGADMLLLLSHEKPPLAMCTFQDIVKTLSNMQTTRQYNRARASQGSRF